MTQQSEKEPLPARPMEGEYLATAVWASDLMRHLKVQSPYAIQKAVDECLNREFVYKSDLWPRYIAGTRKPWGYLIKDLEKIFPKSEQLRSHILWKLLKASGNRPAPANVLEAVDPKVREVAERVVGKELPYEGDYYPLSELTKMASLDALACQLVLLKKYSRRTKSVPPKAVQKRVENITLAAYKTLFILCTQPEIYPFRARIFELVDQLHFVPASEVSGSVLKLRNRSFAELVDILISGAHWLGINWDKKKRDTALNMFQVIEGRYRYDFRTVLWPVMVPRESIETPDGHTKVADTEMERWASESVKGEHPLPLTFDRMDTDDS